MQIRKRQGGRISQGKERVYRKKVSGHGRRRNERVRVPVAGKKNSSGQTGEIMNGHWKIFSLWKKRRTRRTGSGIFRLDCLRESAQGFCMG